MISGRTFRASLSCFAVRPRGFMISAPGKSAPVRSAAVKSQPSNVASLNSASRRLVPLRLQFVSLASQKKGPTEVSAD